MNKLRVWWISQVPMKSFYIPVNSVEEGKKVLDLLAAYDAWQLQNRVKPDYTNVGGLQMYDEDEQDWIDWYIETEADYYDDVDWYYFALKPLPFVFLKVCNKFGYKSSECVVLGDQLLTDILGANLSKMYGIYSKQLQEKDTPITKVNRKVEKFIWRNILHEKV